MYGADLITVDKVSTDRLPFEFNWVSRDWSIDLRGKRWKRSWGNCPCSAIKKNKRIFKSILYIFGNQWMEARKGQIKFVLLRYWWGLLLPQNCCKLVDAFLFYMYKSMPAFPYWRSVFIFIFIYINIVSHFECHKCRYTRLIDTTWCFSCRSDRRVEFPLFSTVCTALAWKHLKLDVVPYL